MFMFMPDVNNITEIAELFQQELWDNEERFLWHIQYSSEGGVWTKKNQDRTH